MPNPVFLAFLGALLLGIGPAYANPPIYGAQPLTSASLGAANGPASLDSTGHLAAGQLPTSVITSSQVGAASGIAQLDSTGKLPAAQLPTTALTTGQVGAASGIAPLNSSSQVPSVNLNFGTTAGTVFDGGRWRSRSR